MTPAEKSRQRHDELMALIDETLEMHGATAEPLESEGS